MKASMSDNSILVDKVGRKMTRKYDKEYFTLVSTKLRSSSEAIQQISKFYTITVKLILSAAKVMVTNDCQKISQIPLPTTWYKVRTTPLCSVQSDVITVVTS